MYKAKKFEASSAEAKAQGNVFAPYLEVLKGSELEELIDKYDLESMEMEAYYPQQNVCDMQSEIAEKMGLFSGDLIALGKSSVSSIGFPPEVSTMAEAFGMLHQIYQAIHQNIPEEEGWRYVVIDDATSKIHFNTPYEEFAGYGYVWAIANKFCPDGKQPTIELEYENDQAVYRINLEDE